MKKIIVALCLILLMITGCGEKTEYPAWTEAPVLTDGTQTLSTEPSEPDTPAPQESLAASFLACGDNMVFYGNVLDAASQPGTRAYNFAHTYQNVRGMIESADISMINQETLMSAEHGFSYYPDFNGPREMGLDLVDVGFDVICLANNHMMDMGEAGLRSTIDFWQEQPVTLIGGHKTKEDYDNIRIVEKNGIKVALLAYTYGTNDYDLTEESTTTLPILSESTVTEQVGRAKAAADFVIVSVHWGEEYSFTPNDYQRNYAEIMTEAGADVIVGHHPHVIQPIEWLTASDGSRTLCAYSLGNFVAEQANDYNMLGGMLSFDMVKTGDTLTIETPVFTPTVFHFDTNFRGNRVYLLEQFTDSLAESHGISHYGNSITVDGIKKYLYNTIDKEFLKQ